MPKQSRKDIKELFTQFYDKFESLVGKECVCEFGPHRFDAYVRGVSLARQADIINLPDKRIDDEGKAYTPPLMIVHCDEGKLVIVLEDIRNVILTITSVCVIMDNIKLRFTEI